MSSGPRAENIRNMFSKVASRYDRANTVLSMGIHHLWRKKLVELVDPEMGDSILDCATGTGDLAIEFKKSVGPDGEVIGTDFCKEMLDSAPEKARAKNLDIFFELADVTKLPYSTQSFDVVSISFGIRNVENPGLAIREMSRVLKPGGRMAILEFGQMKTPLIGDLYNFYSQKVLPKIGGWVTGQEEAYSYLQTSSAAFPCRENFVEFIKSNGEFESVGYHPVSFGIAYIYIAVKPL